MAMNVPYSESHVISALAESGWPEMTENDAIEIWVSYGIRPSLCPITLEEATRRAKARMLKPVRQPVDLRGNKPVDLAPFYQQAAE